MNKGVELMVWNKYLIGEILDRETGNRSEKFGYRVGRECYITVLEVGLPMFVEYVNNDKVFYTSVVEQIDENEYGIWVTTKNRDYRFDNMRLD